MGILIPHIGFLRILNKVIYKLLLSIFDFIASFKFSCESNKFFLFAFDEAVFDEILSLIVNFLILLGEIRMKVFA